jgi:hypothetical protein
MNEQKDERWLDDALRGAINTTRPVFDAEDWQGKYGAAYQALVSRGAGTAGRVASGRVRLMVRWSAVAAVIFVGVSVLLVWMPEREEPGLAVVSPAAGPAGIVSMMSLRMAYREGGQEGLEAQLDRALKDLGPRPMGLSMQELFEELGS